MQAKGILGQQQDKTPQKLSVNTLVVMCHLSSYSPVLGWLVRDISEYSPATTGGGPVALL